MYTCKYVYYKEIHSFHVNLHIIIFGIWGSSYNYMHCTVCVHVQSGYLCEHVSFTCSLFVYSCRCSSNCVRMKCGVYARWACILVSAAVDIVYVPSRCHVYNNMGWRFIWWIQPMCDGWMLWLTKCMNYCAYMYDVCVLKCQSNFNHFLKKLLDTLVKCLWQAWLMV